MGRPEPSLREELFAARARLLRQIEALESPANRLPGAATDNSDLIAELTGVLREIDLRLSELDPDPIDG
jgi:hypothetical protein